MHELHLRLGILGKSFAFLHEVNVYVQLFQGKSVPLIAIQSVRLFNEENPAGPITFEVRHHLRKLLATGSFGRLNLNKFAYNLDSILRCGGTQEFDLGFNGVALFSLFPAGYTCIENRCTWGHFLPFFFWLLRRVLPNVLARPYVPVHFVLTR